MHLIVLAIFAPSPYPSENLSNTWWLDCSLMNFDLSSACILVNFYLSLGGLIVT